MGLVEALWMMVELWCEAEACVTNGFPCLSKRSQDSLFQHSTFPRPPEKLLGAGHTALQPGTPGLFLLCLFPVWASEVQSTQCS